MGSILTTARPILTRRNTSIFSKNAVSIQLLYFINILGYYVLVLAPNFPAILLVSNPYNDLVYVRTRIGFYLSTGQTIITDEKDDNPLMLILGIRSSIHYSDTIYQLPWYLLPIYYCITKVRPLFVAFRVVYSPRSMYLLVPFYLHIRGWYNVQTFYVWINHNFKYLPWRD